MLVAGHSLGGALAALFVNKLARDAVPGGVHLVTFGQPAVGDIDFAEQLRDRVGARSKAPRYARVVNHNDIIPRVPAFFMDDGTPFVHADGANVGRFLDENGVLQQFPAIPWFKNIAHESWRKLKLAWRLSAQGKPRTRNTQYCHRGMRYP